MHLHPGDRESGHWKRAIDVNGRHPDIDFEGVRSNGVAAVIVRAGRGTRQDERWIEHVAAAARAGLAVGSYWHIYPSRATAYRQAELWGAAVRAAATEFLVGHWADVTVSEGLSPDELGLYLDRILRRMDGLTDATTGVFTATSFWSSSVSLTLGDRPIWLSAPAVEPVSPAGQLRSVVSDIQGRFARNLVGVGLTPATTQVPGQHRVRLNDAEPSAHEDLDITQLELVPRGLDESVDAWRSRWTRAPEVSELQHQLNDLGANIVVDGVFGPATDAAVRIVRALRRRDGSADRSADGPAEP